MGRLIYNIYKKDDSIYTRVLKTFGIMLITFFLASVFATAIPNSWVNSNAEKSIAILSKEGNTSFAYSSQKNDGFTDNIMISMSQSHAKGSMDIVDAAMNNSYKSNADPNKTTLASYPRFWHGYTVLLKPALIFFDIQMIRQIAIVLFMVMMSIVAYMLALYISRYIAVAFIISVSVFNPPVVMVNLEYFTTFAVMFLGSIVLLYLLNKKASKKTIASLFLVIGGTTIFFDFLTTPIITWGIPLLIYIAYVVRHHRPFFKELMGSAVLFSIMWAIGYGLIWTSKWIIASIVLNKDVIKNALDTTVYYTSSGAEASGASALQYTVGDMFRLNMEYAPLFQPILIAASIFSFIVLAAMFIRHKTTNQNIGVIFILVCMVAAPFAWMLFSKSHSYIHHWMTNRDFIISTFGILVLSGYMWSKLKIKLKK